MRMKTCSLVQFTFSEKVNNNWLHYARAVPPSDAAALFFQLNICFYFEKMKSPLNSHNILVTTVKDSIQTYPTRPFFFFLI